jgi:hypothetical protein
MEWELSRRGMFSGFVLSVHCCWSVIVGVACTTVSSNAECPSVELESFISIRIEVARPVTALSRVYLTAKAVLERLRALEGSCLCYSSKKAIAV